MANRNERRERALRAAVIAAGLTAAVSGAGCDRLVTRVLDGTGMDGTQCAGWSIRHGSPSGCCDDQGAQYDETRGQCMYPPVPGPFVPPSLRDEA